MNKTGLFCLLISILFISSCKKNDSAEDILNQSIQAIDTIESIYFKQDMIRTNPRQLSDTMHRYREMYFQRLITDSIVGVKGHWYFYNDDKSKVWFEDIFDGNRLFRKNNRDSAIRLYDLAKFPDFKKKHFWSHNTLYGMQYTFKYMLENQDLCKIIRLNDTVFMDKDCYQVVIRYEDKITMPGFQTKFENSEGMISTSFYFIDKETFYPVKMYSEFYSKNNPDERVFIDQTYYDIKFNIEINETVQFNTIKENYSGYIITEIEP